MDTSTCQDYENEIRSLEEEIKSLTEIYEDHQQESTFFSDEEILMAKKSLQGECHGKFKGPMSPSDLKTQLESLETDLSFLMKFTGIQLTNHSKKTVERSGNRTAWKHRLSGNCHSLSFQLEFQLLEVQNKENVSAVVTDLSIILESGEDSGMSKFVSSIEENGNLLSFFRRLSSYAEWCEHRRSTFLHFKLPLIFADPQIGLMTAGTVVSGTVICGATPDFLQNLSEIFVGCLDQDLLFHILHDSFKELRDLQGKSIVAFTETMPSLTEQTVFIKGKYPDIVTLPEGLHGDCLALRNPKVSGLELLIVWKIHMDEEGRTTPVLDLLPKVPEQVLEQKMVTIGDTPAHFRSLLLLFGIEAAVENLIRVVGLQE